MRLHWLVQSPGGQAGPRGRSSRAQKGIVVAVRNQARTDATSRGIRNEERSRPIGVGLEKGNRGLQGYLKVYLALQIDFRFLQT